MIYLFLFCIFVVIIIYLYRDKNYQEPDYIEGFRENRCYYKKVLTNGEYECYSKRNHEFNLDPDLVNNHREFLEYCYYQKLHENDSDTNKILYNKEIINEYQNVYNNISYNPSRTIQASDALNGCTAIMASIFATNINIKKKRNFINTLLDLGFKYTPNDLMFAGLKVYDAISVIVKTNIMLFLNNQDLLPEIKWYVVKMLINRYKIKYYPLPVQTN